MLKKTQEFWVMVKLMPNTLFMEICGPNTLVSRYLPFVIISICYIYYIYLLLFLLNYFSSDRVIQGRTKLIYQGFFFNVFSIQFCIE